VYNFLRRVFVDAGGNIVNEKIGDENSVLRVEQHPTALNDACLLL